MIEWGAPCPDFFDLTPAQYAALDQAWREKMKLKGYTFKPTAAEEAAQNKQAQRAQLAAFRAMAAAKRRDE